VEGAMNVGMDAVFVNYTNVPPRLKPTYMIGHLRELEEIL